jgi:hypothetical protein
MRESYTYLSKAVMVFMLLAGSILFAEGQEKGRRAKVKIALEKATGFLSRIQRTDGALCDTVNRLFESWETVLAATALYETKQDTSDVMLQKALGFLRENENESGLICHNQKCRNGYCLETTSVYYSLLWDIGEKEKVRKGAKMIAAMQKKTGQWEIGNPDVREQKEFPSVTAFVLAMLEKAGAEPHYKKEAYSWLSGKQKEKGDWGRAWEYYNTPVYALWPMMKVLKGVEKKKALDYIYSQQQKDGSWFFHDSLVKRETSRELQTALMLLALYNSGAPNDEAVERGIDFLLSRQNDNGCWDGGYFPIPAERYIKKEYVFATALSMSVLNRYLHDHRK